jgi:hypothetical protein
MSSEKTNCFVLKQRHGKKKAAWAYMESGFQARYFVPGKNAGS